MEADIVTVANVTHAALLEIGRADLAALVQFFPNGDGSWYLEPLDEVSDADYALMCKASTLGE